MRRFLLPLCFAVGCTAGSAEVAGVTQHENADMATAGKDGGRPVDNIVDMLSPGTFVVNPPNPQSGALNLMLTGTGPTGGQIIVDVDSGSGTSGKVSGGSFCVMVTLLTTGPTSFHVKAIDAEGNAVGAPFDTTVTYSPPQVVAPAPTTTPQPTPLNIALHQNVQLWKTVVETGETKNVNDGDDTTGFQFRWYAVDRGGGWPAAMAINVPVDPRGIDHIEMNGISDESSINYLLGQVTVYSTDQQTVTGYSDPDQPGLAGSGTWTKLGSFNPAAGNFVPDGGFPPKAQWYAFTFDYDSANYFSYADFTVYEIGIIVDVPANAPPVTLPPASGPQCPAM